MGCGCRDWDHRGDACSEEVQRRPKVLNSKSNVKRTDNQTCIHKYIGWPRPTNLVEIGLKPATDTGKHSKAQEGYHKRHRPSARKREDNERVSDAAPKERAEGGEDPSPPSTKSEEETIHEVRNARIPQLPEAVKAGGDPAFDEAAPVIGPVVECTKAPLRGIVHITRRVPLVRLSNSGFHVWNSIPE